MVFSKEDEVLINIMCQEKSYGMKNFDNEFPNRKWSPSSLNKLLTKLDYSGSVDCKLGSSNKSKTWIAHNES